MNNLPFQGKCAATEKINSNLSRLEEIASESFIHDMKAKIIASCSSKIFDIHSMHELYSNILQINECAASMIDSGYCNETIIRASNFADESSIIIKDYLVHHFEDYMREYNSQKKEIKSCRNCLAEMQKIRCCMIDYHQKGSEIMEFAEAFGLDINGKDKFYDHKNEIERISEIDKEISSIEMRCRNLNLCDNFRNELKILKKETRTGLIKSRLARECKRHDYYEGLMLLSLIRKKLKYAKKQDTKISGKKEFDFSYYMACVEAPSNFRYFFVHDILNGRLYNDERERLARVSHIMREEKICSPNDAVYIQKIMFGLEQAIKNPIDGFALDEAKEAYQSFYCALNPPSY